MNSVVNVHASLLAYLSMLKGQLETALNTTITVVNFDSYTDMKTLPEGDVIGLAEFSLSTSGDDPLDLCSGIFMAGTVNDPNNMRLIKMINVIYNDAGLTQTLPYYDESNGDDLGIMVFKGETQVLPVEKGMSTKILQGVVFELAAIASNPA